jgi:hypothetical protein
VVLAGAVAFTLLPVSPLPQIDFPVIFVSANLPGASPETMASTWRTPLERALGTIAGVSELSSNSSQGSARINVMFDLGKDINVAAREVQAAINASRSLLPSALPGMPQYRKINPSQAPIMILALTSKTRTAERDVRRRLDGAGAEGGAGHRRRRRHRRRRIAAGDPRRAAALRADAVRHRARTRSGARSRRPTCCGRRAGSRTARASGRSRPATS